MSWADRPVVPADVQACFEMILRRPPESEQVIQHYVGAGMTVRTLMASLVTSTEFRNWSRRRLIMDDLAMPEGATSQPRVGPRVLLFGAYGNGNVGDTAQADALVGLLRQIAPPGAPPGFAACSWEHRAPFASVNFEVLRPDALMRPEHVRLRGGPADRGGADLIVIGGGGLLGAPHFPLHEQGWAEWFVHRGVPFALMGLGGSISALTEPLWRNAYELLLRHATFVGIRDEETLAVARTMRSDAAWFPDPVLADGLLSPAPARLPERRIDVLLIPRAPNSDADRSVVDGMRRLAHEAQARGLVAKTIAVEPEEDERALGSEGIDFIDNWQDLQQVCRQSRVVISARLHGVVAALIAGSTVHGFVQPKIGDLMTRMGMRAWFHQEGWPREQPDLSADASRVFHTNLAPGLARLRADCQAALSRATAALGQVFLPG